MRVRNSENFQQTLKRAILTGAAMQDVWWALLNSNEFILIH